MKNLDRFSISSQIKQELSQLISWNLRNFLQASTLMDKQEVKLTF